MTEQDREFFLTLTDFFLQSIKNLAATPGTGKSTTSEIDKAERLKEDVVNLIPDRDAP